MQTWSPSYSQCVFCTFRAFARTTGRRAQGRPFQTAQWLSREKVKTRPTRTRPRDRVGLLKPTTLAQKTLPFAQIDGHELKQQLAKFKQELQHPPKNASNKLLQCVQLDPNLQHWDAFTKVASAAVEGKETSDIRMNLQRAVRRHGPNGMLVALRSSYTDQLATRKISPEESKFQQSIADLRYPTEWFPRARLLQREIHLHIGPTNSGKTFHALQRLENSKSGFYAGPLRLLAQEVYSTFRAKGIECGLVTGDEIQMDGEPSITSHTVEMAPLGREVEVAVIDEIQMIADKHRGWAWTNALLGAQAKEVHVCGEARTAPLIRELAASMGDTLHIHQYERLNSLKAMTTSLRGDLKRLQKGDCLVCFTIIGLHAMKREIEVLTARRCAIIYGSLPPEIRAQQAELFNDPDNDFDFLVASDAIGMGLNLSIKRIIFESTWRNDGSKMSQLSTSALKQIAGRAGRYRVAPSAGKLDGDAAQNPAENGKAIGLVTSLSERDLPFVQAALSNEPEPLHQAGILPPGPIVARFATNFDFDVPFSYVTRRLHNIALVHPRFFLCDIEQQCLIADAIQHVQRLTPSDRHTVTSAPANVKFGNEKTEKVVNAFSRCIADQKGDLLDIPEVELEVLDLPVAGDRNYLLKLEDLHKALILYIWLSYRFTGVFTDRPMAFYAKSLAEEKIDQGLLEFSANAKLRKQLLVEKQFKIERQMAEQASMKAIEDQKQSEAAVDRSESDDGVGMNQPDVSDTTTSESESTDSLSQESEDVETHGSIDEIEAPEDGSAGAPAGQPGDVEEPLGADFDNSSLSSEPALPEHKAAVHRQSMEEDDDRISADHISGDTTIEANTDEPPSEDNDRDLDKKHVPGSSIFANASGLDKPSSADGSVISDEPTRSDARKKKKDKELSYTLEHVLSVKPFQLFLHESERSLKDIEILLWYNFKQLHLREATALKRGKLISPTQLRQWQKEAWSEIVSAYMEMSSRERRHEKRRIRRLSTRADDANRKPTRTPEKSTLRFPRQSSKEAVHYDQDSSLSDARTGSLPVDLNTPSKEYNFYL